MLSVDGLQSTVCSQQWDNTDARIYCRTLGYNFGRAFGTTYQYTLVPRIVSNVSCSGNEASITDCPFSTASAAYCRGSRNAKVFCYNSQQGGLNVDVAVNKKMRMYTWWSLCTLYLHACQVRVTVCNSGLCYCTCVTYFEH